MGWERGKEKRGATTSSVDDEVHDLAPLAGDAGGVGHADAEARRAAR
jgi:hypothetical protein